MFSSTLITNMEEQPIERVARVITPKITRGKQHGSNSSNLRVLSIPDTVVENNALTPSENNIKQVDSSVKDLDEISDGSLSNNDETSCDKWEVISEDSFEDMVEIDAADDDNTDQLNYTEFTIGYRTPAINYIPKFKKIGVFRPKFFVFPGERKFITFKHENEVFVDNSEEVIFENQSKSPSIDNHVENNGFQNSVLVNKNSEDPVECKVTEIEEKVTNENASLENIENKSEPVGDDVPIKTSETENPVIEVVELSSDCEQVEESDDTSPKNTDIKIDELGYHRGELFIQESIRNFTKSLIGLEYIIEIWESKDVKLHGYSCWLCNKNLEENAVIDHVDNFTHKLKYLCKHFPSESKNFPQEDVISKDTEAKLNSFYEKFSVDSMTLLPFITTKSHLEQNEDALRAVVESSNHLVEEISNDNVNTSEKIASDHDSDIEMCDNNANEDDCDIVIIDEPDVLPLSTTTSSISPISGKDLNKNNVRSTNPNVKKLHKPFCHKNVSPKPSSKDFDELSLDSVSSSAVSECGKDSDSKNKNCENTVDKADAQIGMADSDASTKTKRLRKLSPLRRNKSLVQQHSEQQCGRQTSRHSSYGARSVRQNSPLSSSGFRMRSRSPETHHRAKRFQPSPWLKSRPPRGFGMFGKRGRFSGNPIALKGGLSRGSWHDSRSPPKVRSPIIRARSPITRARSPIIRARSPIMRARPITRTQSSSRDNSPDLISKRYSVREGKEFYSRERRRNRSRSSSRHRRRSPRRPRSRSPTRYRKRSRSHSRKRSLSRSKRSRSVSRSRRVRSRRSRSISTHSRSPSLLQRYRNRSRSKTDDENSLEYRDKRSQSMESHSSGNVGVIPELGTNMLMYESKNIVFNQPVGVQSPQVWNDPIHVHNPQLSSPMLHNQASYNNPTGAFNVLGIVNNQRSMLSSVALTTYPSLQHSVAPPFVHPYASRFPAPPQQPLQHSHSVFPPPVLPHQVRNSRPAPPPQVPQRQIRSRRATPPPQVLPPSNFDIAENLYKKFENSAQLSQVNNANVFQDMRSTLHKIFGTSSSSDSEKSPFLIPGLGDLGSAQSEELDFETKDVLIKAVEEVKSTLRHSSLSGENLQSTMLDMLQKKLLNAGGKAKHPFIPSDAKVQFRESSGHSKSSTIFPILSPQSSSSYNVSQSNYSEQKAILARRLASVLIKLGMLDVSASLLADMVTKIGAFNPSIPLQDITENQIIFVLKKCRYI